MGLNNDQIYGLVVFVLGAKPEEYSLVRFTGLSTSERLPLTGSSALGSKPSTPAATQRDVESRLELMAGRDYVPSVEGEFFDSIKNFYEGGQPTFKGKINGEKAEELGLYEADKKIVRLYADGLFVPLEK